MSIDVREVAKSRWTWFVICLLLLGALSAWLSYRNHDQTAMEYRVSGVHCDGGATWPARTGAIRKAPAQTLRAG